jgi:hypothetical protein
MRFIEETFERMKTDRDFFLTFYIRTCITFLRYYEDPSLWHHEQLGFN